MAEPLERRRLLAAVAWTGTVSNAWDNALNWSTLAVPTAADDVTISAASGTPVTISSGDHSILSLTASQPLAIAGGSLHLANDSSTGGDLTLSGGALYTNGKFDLNGTTTWSAGTLGSGSAGAVYNHAAMYLTNSGDVTLDGVLVNSFVVDQEGTGNLHILSGGGVTNSSSYYLASDSDITGEAGAAVTPYFENTGTGTELDKGAGNGTSILDQNIAFSNRGDLIAGSGVLEIQDPTIPQISASGVLSEGYFRIDGGTLSLPNAPALTGVGYLSLVEFEGAGSAFASAASITQNDGVLGAGLGADFTLSGDLTNNSGLYMGTGGRLHISGNFTHTQYANMNDEIQGTPGSGQYAVIDVSGQVVLQGSLSVNSIMPTAGDVYLLINKLSAGPISGTFNGLPEGHLITDPNSGASYRISYVGGDGNDVTLTTASNSAPTANPGGPYNVNEGSSVVLSSAGSSDPDTSVSGYYWDLDYDGQNFNTDSSLASPTFSAASLDGPTSRTVALIVTDSDGVPSPTATTTVSVANVGPSAGISGPSSTTAGQSNTFFLSSQDPSSADRAAGFTYSIDWDGDGTTDQSVTGVGQQQVTHTFATAGSYSIKVSAVDKDGTSGSVSTTLITVTGSQVALQPDPSDSSKTALVVTGTTGADVIRLVSAKKSGQVQVYFGNTLQGTYSPTGRIIVDGGAGNDSIVNSTGLPSILFGGDGNDTISGGGAQDILIGGAGNDVITGGGGADRDLLIGGAGSDNVSGSQGEDLLIAAATDMDANTFSNQQLLSSILAQWNTGKYSDRVTALTPIISPKVHEDSAADTLNGGSANDWFFAHTAAVADQLIGKTGGETLTLV